MEYVEAFFKMIIMAVVGIGYLLLNAPLLLMILVLLYFSVGMLKLFWMGIERLIGL